MSKNDQLINQPNEVSYLIPSLLPPGEKFCVVNDHGGAEIIVLSEGQKCLLCCNRCCTGVLKPCDCPQSSATNTCPSGIFVHIAMTTLSRLTALFTVAKAMFHVGSGS